MSAKSRTKGHGYERRGARELSARTGLKIVTTRSLGANYGADLATVTSHDAHGRPVDSIPSVCGWSVEAKNEKAWRPEAWLAQAIGQAAPDTTPVVLANRPNAPFGRGWAITPHPRFGWVATSIDNWMETL